MPSFVALAAMVGIAMLIWDCVEVGRNDAANLVNAILGARVMRRRLAIAIAAFAVVLGASFSSPVMETARKGIFDPSVLTIQMALAIYVSVYFVDTILLYGFSGFGMPVSTTACLVFELVGAALFLVGFDNVQWGKVGTVTVGIVVSIVISGTAAFLVMRIFRAAIGKTLGDRKATMLHGPWIAGAIASWLVWFMLFKGLKNIEYVKYVKSLTFEAYGEVPVLLGLWVAFTVGTYVLLLTLPRDWSRHLFSTTAVLGMICLAFAFGQNDLANAASPGLAGLALWQSGSAPGDVADIATKIPIPVFALFGCGLLMAMGMFTIYAQRVTGAQIKTGSQVDEVTLYAPRWCRWIASTLLGFGRSRPDTAAAPARQESDQTVHYDTLRASVITAVSASVIAFASGRGLPVSTTYVAFAAVLGSGLADRVFSRGDSDTKLGRAIWVISCWFIAPVIAVVATGCVALIVYHLSTAGLVLCIGLNLGSRLILKRRADRHEQLHHETSPREASIVEPEGQLT